LLNDDETSMKGTMNGKGEEEEKRGEERKDKAKKRKEV